jgi:mono/diheme cytochrome c family protein
MISLIFGGPAHRRATVVIGLALVLVALTILTIGANSPYTHANLAVAYDERYTRTDQIVVGPPAEFAGLETTTPTASDPLGRGAWLYVTRGCAACHSLDAGGSAVGKPLLAVTDEVLLTKVRTGGPGMPAFSTNGLSDTQLADIIAYLRSLPKK